MSALDPGVLGAAGPTGFRTNFDNVQKINTIYPIAMAEKIAGYELNDPEDHDISMNFSNGIDWYFDIDRTLLVINMIMCQLFYMK